MPFNAGFAMSNSLTAIPYCFAIEYFVSFGKTFLMISSVVRLAFSFSSSAISFFEEVWFDKETVEDALPGILIFWPIFNPNDPIAGLAWFNSCKLTLYVFAIP